MRLTNAFKFLIGLLAVAFSSFSFVSATFAEQAKSESSWTGFLVDRACAATIKNDGGNVVDKVKKHTRHCNMEPSCCEAGYSLLVGDTWYDLDAKGNSMALEMLKKSKIEKANRVKVQGIFKRSEIKVSTIVEAK
jgi:hypothetical protein